MQPVLHIWRRSFNRASKKYLYSPEPDAFFGSSSTPFLDESLPDSLFIDVEAGSSFTDVEFSVSLCHTDFKKPSCLEVSVVFDSERDALVGLENQNSLYF
jgi:hypothetical protein